MKIWDSAYICGATQVENLCRELDEANWLGELLYLYLTQNNNNNFFLQKMSKTIYVVIVVWLFDEVVSY